MNKKDCTYAIGEDICRCRTDYKHKLQLEDIFQEKRNLFQLAYSEKINNIDFIFSHAGITKGWINYNFKELKIDDNNVVDFMNNMWLTQDYNALDTLGQYDNYRSYFGYPYGSPIWADIRSTNKLKKEESYGDFQIVGHTQLSTDVPLIFENIGDFDCRHCFYINSNGDILSYDNDKICEKTKREPTE